MEVNPENVQGRKVVTHSVEHRVDWGYVAAGVGLLVVAYVAYRVLGPPGGDDDDAGGPLST